MKELQLIEEAPEPWHHQLLDVLWQFLQGLLELLQLAWNALTCSNGLPLAAKKNDDLGQRHLKPPKRRGGGAGPHVNVMVVGAPLPGVKKSHGQARQQQPNLPPHHTSKPRVGGHYHGYHHHHHQHAQQQQQQRPGRQGHPLLLSSPRDYSGPLSPADVPAAVSPRGSSYSLPPHPHLLASPAGSSHHAPGRVSAAPHRQASGSSLLWHQQSQAGLLSEGGQGGAAAAAGSQQQQQQQLQRGDSRAGSSEVSSPRQGAALSTSAPGSSYPVIPFEELELGDLVGTGGFARVFKARWRGAEVAVKLLNPESSSRASVLDEFRRELAVLASLRPHPNIVRLVGACTQPPNLAVVTEYCSGGSLYALLHNPRARLGWGRLVDICLGAARGVQFLHSSGILHRDLKSGNLLLDGEGSIKLADFGLSRVAGHAGPMTGGLGTFQWMAPEVLGHQRYSQKADTYSFAILMWEAAARQIPYSGMDGVQAALAVVNRGLRPEIPPHTPPPFARLMQACWAPTPDQRPEFGWVVSRLEALAAEVRQLEQQQREREQQQWEAAGEGAGDEEQPLRGGAGADDDSALCDVV